jgi:hypothetical protein
MTPVLAGAIAVGVVVVVTAVALVVIGRSIRTVPQGPDVSWVAAREGLVEFSGGGTRCVPWTALRNVELLRGEGDEGVRLTLDPTVPLQQYVLGDFEPLDAVVAIPSSAMVDVPPVVFADMVRRAWVDPSDRAKLPTFAQPDGPPEAVLADLDRGNDRGTVAEEVGMSFRSDLAKLIGGLDPSAHAHEIDTLQRCRRLDDLQMLADSNGGWISKGTRDPRIKLVKHGSGTFLLVQYDQGWSKTLSQAPFSTGRIGRR